MTKACPQYNAIVEPLQSHDDTNRSLFAGVPSYPTIQAALDAAPAAAKTPFIIYIRNGRYHEKIIVEKSNIMFLGENREQTILSYDDYSGVKDSDGKSIGTWRCASVIIRAPDFRAVNLTIENTFDYLTNDARGANDPARTNEPQAVALMTDHGADRTYLSNIQLLGYQDTLFTLAGRTYISKSTITGNIDFIFGAGQTVIDQCEIISRPRGVKLPAGEMVGFITAPSTPYVDQFGLIILNSRLLRENNQVPPASCPLGRPWHPTTSFPDGRYANPNAVGAAFFINCWMDDHIAAAGWDKMQGTARTQGKKDWFYPDDPAHARFAEFCSSGPGAQKHPLRRQLTPSEAELCNPLKVLRGWQPEPIE